MRAARRAWLGVEVACRGLLALGARFPGCRFARFTLRLRRGCVVLTVAGRCLFVSCKSRGCCHLVRARGALACTATATAASTTAPTAAPTAAFDALGAAFRRRRWGGHSAGCVLMWRLGGAAVAVIAALDGLALDTVAITRALGKAFTAALCGCLVTATTLAVAVPIAVVAPTIPVATLAAAIALASGTVAMTRIARMLAPSLAPLTLIAPCGARGRGDARFGRGLGRRRGGSFAGQDSLDA